MLTFDPHNYKGATDRAITDLIYDTLVGADPVTLELVPRLALKWSATTDTTWRLELRKNVQFTDGTPFNAETVKFNIERAQQAARSKSYVAPVKAINVVDDSTIEFITDGPNAALMRNLSVAILGMVSPKQAQTGEDALNATPVGTGPFVLREWIPKQQIVLERNPDYWGEKAYLDQITFFPVPDDSSRLAAFQAGDFDAMINPPLEAVKQLQADSNVQVAVSPVARTVWLGLNVGDETLSNENLRQAMAYAIDGQLLATTVAEGLVRPAVGLVPPEVLKPNFELPYTYDTSAAEKALSEAGFSNGVKVELWTPEGRYLKDRQIAEAIQQQLKDVGIDTELSVLEFGPYLDSLARYEQQLYIIGWGFSSGDPDASLREIAWSQSGFNYMNYKDPQFDAALDAAIKEIDPKKRADMYNAMQRTMIEKVYCVPIYHGTTISVANSKVKGFLMTPLETFDLKGAYIEES